MIHFTVEKLNRYLTRIQSPLGVCCYLIKGQNKAVLIDTGIGIGSLKAVVEDLIETDYCVVLTHAHLDHAGGSYVIIVLVVKSLLKSRVLVLLQNIKTLKNSNLCVV